ncbi:hypothetical protein [Vibrio sp. CJQ_6]|uniref:hypothetical protein n=1 Tax=Vibrio sp. CJQ_6 TaxID=3367165 RepID=UPI00370B0CD0
MNYFDGSSFGVVESIDKKDYVHSNFMKNKDSLAIIDTYILYTGWWNKTKQVFDSCVDVARPKGKLRIEYLSRSNASFETYHYIFLSSPTVLENFGIWAMYQAIQNAELKFIEQCKTPRNEISLTGKLTSNIDHCASKIQSDYEKHLYMDNISIIMNEIELQVQNREKITGADFALLLEWYDRANYLKVCPIYFQAKRVINEMADISQFNKEVGYQFTLLKSREINSAYIFYNCNTQKITPNPRLPSVKDVRDVSSNEFPDKTSAVENVLSLSTFLLDVMVNSNRYTVFNNRKDALRAILVNIKEDELSRVFTLSVDEGAKERYREEYILYMNYKKNKSIDIYGA